MALVVYGIFVALIILFCMKYKNSTKFIKKFPSPPGIPFFGNALDFKSSSDLIPMFEKYTRYGKIVKISFGPIKKFLISDCKLLEYILTTNKTIDKGHEYNSARNWLGKGLLTSNGDKEWKKHRKVIARAFHKDIYHNFIKAFENNSTVLVEKLKGEIGRSSFDIAPFIQLCSLDIICDAVLGKSFKAQENSESEYVTTIKFMCKLIIDRSFNIFLFHDFLYKFTKLYRREQKALKILRSFVDKIIDDRQEELFKAQKNGNNSKLIFLDLLLEENLANQTFPRSAIQDEVQTLIFAGHDTVSTAISFAVYCLSNYLHVQQQVLDEYLDVVGRNIDKTITIEDLQALKYLDAVIKEVLRLYPPVPYYSRIGPDFEYDGHIISGNSSLIFNVYGIHRDETIYTDPHKFIPERFFGQQEFGCSYLPFSAGSRSCIGQKFAMFEIKYLLVTLLKHYEILPSTPKHEVELVDETVLISKNGIRVAIRERILS
ncbi:hypothetical protein RI129_004605 [Pyrocoelia pectoralis]|uniref:Cytochrome P450 n=1 Tax=Pyrocoelia pectoralis TaxID=417401 RepID=A0AAN7VJL2_9COLE